MLGSHPDDAVAVDASVHHWLSAFMPHPYFGIHRGCFYPFRKGGTNVPFGDVESSVEMILLDKPNHRPEWFSAYKGCLDHVGHPETMIAFEALPARTSGSKLTPDDLDRLYAQLASPHRGSFKRFQDMGLVLPFGAVNIHFMTPNRYFFSPSKTWWTPPRTAYPLDGWDIGKVIAAGITYGAQSEDIYGCLYYYLTDQLKEFRRRIRSKVTVTFRVMALPAADLCATIRRQRPSMRFDRIELGSTVDHDKAGLKSAVQMWAPLLAAQRDAAITGLCRAWTDIQPNGKAKGAGDGAVREALRAVVENMKSQKPVDTILSGIGSNEGLFFSVCHNVEMGYDNSKAFASYIEKQGLKEVESRSGLKLRNTHRIVPHRIGVPVGGRSSALPEFENEEAWYHATMLNSISWSDRYVEFGREE